MPILLGILGSYKLSTRISDKIYTSKSSSNQPTQHSSKFWTGPAQQNPLQPPSNIQLDENAIRTLNEKAKMLPEKNHNCSRGT